MPGLVSSHRRQPSQGGAAAVVILGDASSAGYLSDDNGERAFVEAAARGVGMSVLAGEQRRSARVHGYCEALGCKAYRGKGAPAHPSEPKQSTSASGANRTRPCI